MNKIINGHVFRCSGKAYINAILDLLKGEPLELPVDVFREYPGEYPVLGDSDGMPRPVRSVASGAEDSTLKVGFGWIPVLDNRDVVLDGSEPEALDDLFKAVWYYFSQGIPTYFGKTEEEFLADHERDM